MDLHSLHEKQTGQDRSHNMYKAGTCLDNNDMNPLSTWSHSHESCSAQNERKQLKHTQTFQHAPYWQRYKATFVIQLAAELLDLMSGVKPPYFASPRD